MTPTRLLLAAGLTAAALVWTVPSGAVAAGAEEGDRAVFTGSFVTRPQEAEQPDGTTVRRYQVEVEQVFTDVEIATERVTVVSSAVLESCGEKPDRPRQGGTGGTGGTGGNGGTGSQSEQPGDGPTSAPSSPGASPTQAPTQSPTGPTGTPIDRQRRVFDATFTDGRYVVASCKDVRLASDALVADLEKQFPDHHPPGADATPTPDPVTNVTYLCPDDREALPEDLDDAGSSSTCDALADDQAFDRTAAPGLALVIVGVLGLLVARRVGRR